jgi:hypothetical protein
MPTPAKQLFRRDYSAQSKTIAASTTNTFTSSDIPSQGVYRYHIVWGGNTRIDHLTRLRVKANGVSIYDLGPSMLRAFIRRFSPSNYPTPLANIANSNTIGTASASTTSQGGTSARRFTIPFDLLDADTEEERLSTQFPPGSQVTIELQWGSSASAGSIFCGWSETRVPALYYPKLYASQMNIAAGIANGRYNIQDDGQVRAVGVNTVGLDRFKVVLGGQQIFHAQGVNQAGTATGDMIAETEQLENGFSEISEALTTTPSAASVNLVSADVIDPMFIRLDGDQAVPGSSYVELQTDSGGVAWAGAANELCVHSRVALR